jgi:predicted O-linked N-acetylglucosamine transferase (SPINDLY family)
MLEEQRAWDRVQGRAGRLHRCAVRVRENHPERRLRIGYVSPDLHRHPVSYFFEPLLAAHDKTRFDVFCYANHPSCYSDDVTQRLQSLSGHWRSVLGRSDQELARIIHDDGIDILVDLAGHTYGNRLRAFTYRPAPVQATYLGFFAATGLEAMDYWVSDEVLHPLDTQEQAVEQIYRLPRCWVCYLPPAGAPDVSPPPSRDVQVTFGSFNNLTKLSPEVIETWSQLLRQLEGSQLLVMDKPLGEIGTRQRLLEQFGGHGITADRLTLRSGAPFEQYLATYAEVDIALDPFPRTGGTTTAEALWMGVPVITLAGQRYVERISTSKLTAVGLQDLVASSREEYIRIALLLARNPSRRAELRGNLRDRMAKSPLCDAAGLANAMESAYESMWQRFLSEQVAKADGTSCTSMHVEQSQK